MSPLPVVWFSLVDGERPEDKWDSLWLRNVLYSGGLHLQVWDEHDERLEQLTGALVVMPGGVHARPDLMARVRVFLHRLPWAVVLVTADEQSLFPGGLLEEEMPHVRVFMQTPKGTNLRHPRVFGYASTWANGVNGPSVDWQEPSTDWSWAGQVNNDARRALVNHLTAKNQRSPGSGELHVSAGFSEGLDHDTEYRELLTRSKVVPCPPGATTVDTFRVWEAIEHGAIPVVTDDPYWGAVAPGNSRLPTVTQWDTPNLPEVLGWWADRWPGESNRLWSWWFQERQRLMAEIRSAVLEVGGEWDVGSLAVVMTSSPTPANPSTDTIEKAVASVRERTGAPIWLLLDGPGPRLRTELEAQRDYGLFVNRVLWLAEHQWSGVIPVVHQQWRHQTGMVSKLLNSGAVQQRHLLVMEHDSLLYGDVPLDHLEAMLDEGAADVVRLAYGPSVNPHHEHMYIDPEPRWWFSPSCENSYGVRHRRTWQWSQQPHLARTAYYQGILQGLPDQCYIEEAVSSVLSSRWVAYGIDSWFSHRIVLYTPEGDDIRRSAHIDDRGGDERFLGRP